MIFKGGWRETKCLLKGTLVFVDELEGTFMSGHLRLFIGKIGLWDVRVAKRNYWQKKVLYENAENLLKKRNSWKILKLGRYFHWFWA